MKQSAAIMFYTNIAIESDGDFDIDELWIVRSYFIECGFCNEDSDDFEKIIDEFQKVKESYDVEKILDMANASLTEDLKKTVFALCLKIIISDGDITDSEKNIIRTIGDLLEISNEERSKILDVLCILMEKPED